jgi:hypothetical protein
MTQMKHNVMMTLLIALTIFVAGCAGPVLLIPVATNSRDSMATPTPSAYRALLDSEIRGIDPETIAGYLAGEGLGMALSAELNSYPGPRHVLDTDMVLPFLAVFNTKFA